MRDNFINSIREFSKTISPETRVFLGSDSRRKKRHDGKYQINYTLSVVFHLDGKHGCKVFAMVDREVDFHGQLSMRLMSEAIKISALFEELVDVLPLDRTEIHLDLNTDPKHKSNKVLASASGYVRGVTGIEPKVKPEAWAASTCSDLWELKFG